MAWLGVEAHMKFLLSLSTELYDAVIQLPDEDDSFETFEPRESYATTVLEAKYESHTSDDIASKQTHLTCLQTCPR